MCACEPGAYRAETPLRRPGRGFPLLALSGISESNRVLPAPKAGGLPSPSFPFAGVLSSYTTALGSWRLAWPARPSGHWTRRRNHVRAAGTRTRTSGSSGWTDSNRRPPGPQPGALTNLRYNPRALVDWPAEDSADNQENRWSEWADSNRRPLRPERSALAKLRHTPILRSSEPCFASPAAWQRPQPAGPWGRSWRGRPASAVFRISRLLTAAKRLPA